MSCMQCAAAPRSAGSPRPHLHQGPYGRGPRLRLGPLRRRRLARQQLSQLALTRLRVDIQAVI
jgi:hypothetical protein